MSNENLPSASALKPRRIPVAVALVIGIMVGGLGASLIVGPAGAEKAPHPECSCEGELGAHGAPGVRPLHTVGDLVLNPAGTGGSRFLILSVAFSARDAGVVERMRERDLEVRDVLLKVLGARSVSELADVSARPALKTEVRDRMGALFGSGSIQDVFFPQFVIQ